MIFLLKFFLGHTKTIETTIKFLRSIVIITFLDDDFAVDETLGLVTDVEPGFVAATFFCDAVDQCGLIE